MDRKATGCYADTITANPNRPTVSNPAHVTQYGVLELEYGRDRLWPEAGIHQTSVGGLLKLGMLCDIELRWSTTSFLSQTDAGGTSRTLGDNWLGTEIRVHRETRRLPTMAFSYAFKMWDLATGDALVGQYFNLNPTVLARPAFIAALPVDSATPVHSGQLASHDVQLAAQKENIETNQQNIGANKERIEQNIKDIEEHESRIPGR